VKNQQYCGKKECQRARKRSWQKEKIATDPDYRANQRECNKAWRGRNPDYWRHYRKNHPRYVEKNRLLQKARRRRRVVKMDAFAIKVVLVPVTRVDALISLNKELDRRNQFIRKTFCRYTSDEIVDVMLDASAGLKLGGEKRQVILLMSYIRVFTALAQRLEATEVVAILNHYLPIMVEITQASGGNVDEIIGDAILVIFGAPLAMSDSAVRAVRCALEMQTAMCGVNQHNIQMGWPEIEMGIALHTGEVVVGNIGSTRRSKYAAVGQPVNLTARIESFTVGGRS
jgi:class 3 adenylate cyclase